MTPAGAGTKKQKVYYSAVVIIYRCYEDEPQEGLSSPRTFGIHILLFSDWLDMPKFLAHFAVHAGKHFTHR